MHTRRHTQVIHLNAQLITIRSNGKEKGGKTETKAVDGTDRKAQNGGVSKR